MSKPQEKLSVEQLTLDVVAANERCNALQEALAQAQLRLDQTLLAVFVVLEGSDGLRDAFARYDACFPDARVEPRTASTTSAASATAPTPDKPKRERRPRATKRDRPKADEAPPAEEPKPPPGAPLAAAEADECPGCKSRSVVWDPALGDVICRNCSRVATEEYVKRAQKPAADAKPTDEPSPAPDKGEALPQVRRRARKQLRLPGVKP